MVVDNVATDIGGGIALDDSSNVRIVNNTIADNATTATAEDSDGEPHGAGLASEPHGSLPGDLPPGRGDFSNPVALFNNIFWQNQAFTLDASRARPTLVDRGVIDLEVHATATTARAADSSPRATRVLTPLTGPAHPGNIVGQRPELRERRPGSTSSSSSTADPARADGHGQPARPAGAAVTITGRPAGRPAGRLPPAGRLAANTPAAVDRGLPCSNTPCPRPPRRSSVPGRWARSPPSGTTIDGQCRRSGGPLRVRTPWDIGADERPVRSERR